MTDSSDPARAPALSVVLPAYRLGDVIAETLDRVTAALPDADTEVVVVDDGSPDETSAVVAAHRDPRVRLVRHPSNLGKGEALVSGWRASEGELVVFLDADLDLPPEQVPAMVERLGDADVVVGSKREAMAAGNYPGLRRLLSRAFAGGISLLFRLPVSETQTGLKVFRREVLEAVLPAVRTRGYAFDLELLVRAHRAGYRLVEAPVTLDRRAAGASLRSSMMWDLARDTLRVWVWTFTDRRMRGG